MRNKKFALKVKAGCTMQFAEALHEKL